MNNFDLAFNYLISFDEGQKYTNDPDDAGGPTKYGITLRIYQQFYDKNATADDVQNMSADQARAIYLSLWWNALDCPKMSTPSIAIAIFDTAVLYGIRTAALIAQKALSSIGGFDLKFDGVIGDKSVNFLNMVKGDEFLEMYRGLVLNRIDEVIEKFPRNQKYRDGWTKRADRLLTLNDNDFLIKLSQIVIV